MGVSLSTNFSLVKSITGSRASLSPNYDMALKDGGKMTGGSNPNIKYVLIREYVLMRD